MNVPSIIIVAFLFVLAGLAVWRNIRKGAPCSCGKCGACKGGCSYGEKGATGASLPEKKQGFVNK